MGANAHYPMSGYEAKHFCIPYTVMNSVKVGRALRETNQQGGDPIRKFCELVGGQELFRGIITQLKSVDRGGFYLTDVFIKGIGHYSESMAKLVVKNETMALWVDSQIRIIFPDCAFMLDPVTAKGIPSIDLVEGKEMVIVGAPVHERIREFLDTEIGRQSYGGVRYGYPDLTYQPFEKLNLS
jgi:DUF917 family protein